MSRLTERELELIRRERLAAERDAGPQATAGFFATFIVDPIRRSLRRRQTFAELSRLDDRMLRDIGLERDSLATLADELTRDGKRSGATSSLIARFRRWRWRQATIAQLQALDDHTLEDIGIVRGNIPYVVDSAMAAEESAQAAPRSVDHLLRRIDARAPRPTVADPARRDAKAMAQHALQVASQRPAS